jgi:ribosomal protein S12 methylthiotransferase accessory factor
LHLFYSKTDLRIHSFISIVIDKTRNPPIIGCGLKASIDPEEAALGSIEESFNAMPWKRELAEKFPNKKIKPESISSFEDRIIYWNQRGMLKELDFLLKNPNEIKLSELQNYTSGSCINDLQFVKEDLKNKNLETIVVDVTPIDVEQIGFKEVKVIIPRMQPLYLQEKYKYLGGSRLYEIPKLLGFKQKKEEELNKTPHPFL